MNKKPRNSVRVLIAVTAGTIVGAMIFAFSGESESPDYSGFVHRKLAYHGELAIACERIFLGVPEDADNTYRFAPGDPRLPTVICKLKPSEVIVARNLQIDNRQVSFVRLRIGNSVAGYSILFEPANLNSNVDWQLSAAQEQQNRILWVGRGVP